MFHRCSPYTGAAVLGSTPQVLGAPPWVQALHAQLTRGAALRRAPRLVWLSHANGRGGFTNGELLALGQEDARRMAEQIAGKLGPARAWAASAADAFVAVVRVILAHELGHVVQAEHGMLVQHRLAERAADGYAGQVAETHGWPAWLDALVMSAGGCQDGRCEHAASAQRVADYHEGRGRIRARARLAA
jgi:hypothetical protein